MRRSGSSAFALTVVLLVVLLLQPVTALAAGFAPGAPLLPPAPSLAGPGPVQGQARANVISSLGQLPLYFIENQGQVDSQVAYYLAGGESSIYFRSGGLTFALSGTPASSVTATGEELPAVTVSYGLKLDFLGARDVRPVGEGKTEAVVSYFKGKPEQWHTGLSTYSRIAYPDLWPGIDLVYYGRGAELKYEFVVHPGADPAQIRLAYCGASALSVDEAGQLQVVTPVRTISDAAPVAYQEVGGERRTVAATYALDEETATPDMHAYGFQVGAYDRSLSLVLDPGLIYSGFLGGSGDDFGNSIAVDSSGNAYVTGWTSSTDFPTKTGPDLDYNGPNDDVFVAKVNPSGTGLVYAGFLGGSSGEEGYGIAVDSAGNAYVTGVTDSDDFPTLVGPDPSYIGNGDAFVAKVNPSGTALVYSGLLGGSGADYVYGIAVDSLGNAYVTGRTDSDDFPVVAWPYTSYKGGDWDAFVAEVRADGSNFVYSGYLGGSSWDGSNGIAVDSAGNAYVTGATWSDDFPTKGSWPYNNNSYNGAADVFVTKVNPSGAGLAYSVFLGGAGDDVGRSIAVDSSGSAYITGDTNSEDFPTLVGPYAGYNGSYDAFVAKMNPSGTDLVYSGFLGGDSYDEGDGIAVDSSGNAYVTGYTSSSDFPAQGPWPYNRYNGGSEDAFVAKVSSSGALAYSGFLGGSGDEEGSSIAVDSSGNAYVTGGTTSGDFPARVGPDTGYNGGEFGDAFVAKIGLGPSYSVYLPIVTRNH
jgi:hypothetical protein